MHATLHSTVELAATGAPSAAVVPAFAGRGLLGSVAAASAVTRLRTLVGRSARER